MILFVKLQLLLGDLPVVAPEMLHFKLDFANHCTSPSYCALSKQSWQKSSCRTHYSHINLETVLSDSHFTEPRYTTTRRQKAALSCLYKLRRCWLWTGTHKQSVPNCKQAKGNYRSLNTCYCSSGFWLSKHKDRQWQRRLREQQVHGGWAGILCIQNTYTAAILQLPNYCFIP